MLPSVYICSEIEFFAEIQIDVQQLDVMVLILVSISHLRSFVRVGSKDTGLTEDSRCASLPGFCIRFPLNWKNVEFL